MSDEVQANAVVEESGSNGAVGDVSVEQQLPAAAAEMQAAIVEQVGSSPASRTGSAAEQRLGRQRGPERLGFEGDQAMPFDKLALSGELENGLAYYVRANTHPRERAELRIAIKVGSVMEEEEERGVAHMIEHLAFRASRTCPQEFDLVKELESHGIKFGAHQNAYTSFEETVYELHVPADSPVLLERSLRVLRQLALEVRLSDDDVERERSIVVEEWRQGRGCTQRATEEFFKLVVKDSLFEKRLPIGLMEVIKSVTPETVRAFYARHYHPERMAVIAVGDFPDGGQGVAALIADVFGACPRGGVGAPSPVDVPSHYDVRAAVFSDREATSSSLVLEVKKPSLPLVSHNDYRREVTEDLFHACLNARLSKTAMRDRPPFLTASSSTPATLASLSTVQLVVTSLDGGLPRAMKAVLTEVHRVKVHGFSDREMSMAKRNHLAEVRGEWVARDQTDSNTLCGEYLEHFLRQNPVPGIEWEAGVLGPLLETVVTEDVNRVAERYAWGKNTVVFATCPAPRKLTRLQGWLVETFPSAITWPFGGGGGGGGGGGTSKTRRRPIGTGASPVPASGIGVVEGVPTQDDLLDIVGRFEERGNDTGGLEDGGGGSGGRDVTGRWRLGSWERVREWSHDRWGETLEVEDLLPDYLLTGPAAAAAGVCVAAGTVGQSSTGVAAPPNAPSAGAVVGAAVAAQEEEENDGGDIDVHEMKLANGLQVTYKCTNFCDDEVLFSGLANGGRTELPPDKAPSALMSVTVAEELGIFGIKPSKAMDMLTGKRVSLGLSIEAYDREVSGSCAAADLEAALQLLHLLFVAELRWDEGRLETVLSYVEEHVRNQDKDPHERLMGLINTVNTQGHPFHATPSLALLAKVDPRWAAAYFKSQFRNPAAFRFVFVGSMDPVVAVPLMHKYLGSIPLPADVPPSAGSGHNVAGVQQESSVVLPWYEPVRRRNDVTPLNVRFPTKKVSKTVRVPMNDPYAVSAITFPVALGGERHPTHMDRLRDNILIQFAASVLEKRLNEVLRFSLGRTYGVTVEDSFSSAPPMVKPSQPLPGTVMITLSCEPQELPLLQSTTISELKKLQEEGPRPEEIRGAVEADRRDRETADRTNSYWLQGLSVQYVSPRYKGDVRKAYAEQVGCRKEVQASLSKEVLREAYVHFFGDLQRRTEVSLLPQTRWKSTGRYVALGALAAGVATAGVLAVSRARKGRNLP